MHGDAPCAPDGRAMATAPAAAGRRGPVGGGAEARTEGGEAHRDAAVRTTRSSQPTTEQARHATTAGSHLTREGPRPSHGGCGWPERAKGNEGDERPAYQPPA